jgi:hypothetical protein
MDDANCEYSIIADNCAKTGWNAVPDNIIRFVLKNKYLLTVHCFCMPNQHQDRQLLLVMCAKLASGQLLSYVPS